MVKWREEGKREWQMGFHRCSEEKMAYQDLETQEATARDLGSSHWDRSWITSHGGALGLGHGLPLRMVGRADGGTILDLLLSITRFDLFSLSLSLWICFQMSAYLWTIGLAEGRKDGGLGGTWTATDLPGAGDTSS